MKMRTKPEILIMFKLVEADLKTQWHAGVVDTLAWVLEYLDTEELEDMIINEGD